jgi:hypothetical protein
LGVPLVLLRGYGSQSYIDDISEMVENDGRPAVLAYCGDYDPTGEDILRDFLKRCPVWSAVERVAVTPEQLDDYSLPVNQGKWADTRASKFTAKHGALVQVEVEAIPPETLRDLYQDVIDTYWDHAAYGTVIEREDEGRAHLLALAEALSEAGDDL